jgi:hypothetical protein
MFMERTSLKQKYKKYFIINEVCSVYCVTHRRCAKQKRRYSCLAAFPRAKEDK